jgi:hypothetical protein
MDFVRTPRRGDGGSRRGSPAPNYDTKAQMISPATCATCHQQHFNDWYASMHRQAADDPVFVAMNARGQRTTNGKLGTFCVQCHAPMAVREGLTKDGLNLASMDPVYKGVTCYFCHSIDAIEADAGNDNAGVHIADDLVMRGELQNPPPVANPVHASKYSTLHDDQQHDSAVMCGTCHDIASPAGGRIERTFLEWEASPFATAGEYGGETCSAAGCHMTPNPVPMPVATGGPNRHYHPHDFPAVDVPLVPNPPNLAAVQDALDNDSITGALCVSLNSGIEVILDTPKLGHDWPSGASQDRRAWLEVIAYDGNNNVIYSSGVVPPGVAVTDTAYNPATDAGDPDLFLLRDCMFDAQGKETHNFWQAATRNGYELPPLASFDASALAYTSHIFLTYPGPNNRVRYPMGLLTEKPARVTLRLLLQPVGLDVLNDLVDSGDLSPDSGAIANMPTFSVSLQGPTGPGFAAPGGLEWSPAAVDDAGVETALGGCVRTPAFTIFPQTEGKSFATCTPVPH